MSGTTRHLFAEGNTARGLYSLYESAFRGLRHVIVLQGEPGTGKSSLIRRIADDMSGRGQRLELFHSPRDPETLDGLIATDLRIGVVDGAAFADAETALPETAVQTFDFGEAVDAERLADRREEIANLLERIDTEHQGAYECFQRALRVHDEWEQIYIGNMSFEKADRIVEELMAELFGASGQGTNEAGGIRHLFLGAATPQGAVDYVPNITESASKRIFIKGRPGSGKSTMLKKLAAEAEKRRFHVEMFHCGFDPNSIDMVIVPELGTAIFDSTAPHEHNPSREGDEILDMYERTMEPGTDERYSEQLARVKSEYSAAMKQATSCLAAAYSLRLRLRAVYGNATDYTVADRIGGQVLKEIERLAGKAYNESAGVSG